MILVADEPLRGALLELAHLNGYGAFACSTPLDVIDTLVDFGDQVSCAILDDSAGWSAGLPEFLADEYPHIERIAIAG